MSCPICLDHCQHCHSRKAAEAYSSKQDLGICDEWGGQFSDLAGHKALGVQTHPWLKATDLNSAKQEGE